MINIKYRLVSPNQIDVQFSEENINNYELVIKPKYLSICKADQRYYKGMRSKEILDKKLPMSLIHESIGQVVYSKNPNFQKNDYVVFLPNIPIENNNCIKENYLKTSKFCGSNTDGFMQENIFCNSNNVIKLPNGNPNFVFLELMSIVFNAIENFKNFDFKNIVIYGDGSLSYVACIILKHIYKNANITVIGKHLEKLKYFTLADATFLTNKVPSDLEYDCVFECVGGDNQEKVLKDIINTILPQGYIFLLGVSENEISVNTRLVLEKGLVLLGCSRSGRNDFQAAIDLINANPEILNYLNALISNLVEVNGVDEMNYSFLIDNTNEFKTVMKWNL